MQSTEHILGGYHRVSGNEKQVWTVPIVDIGLHRICNHCGMR